MNKKSSLVPRSVIILTLSVVLGVLAYVVSSLIWKCTREMVGGSIKTEEVPVIAAEASVFHLSTAALQTNYKADSGITTKRNLATYYKRRAYPGAPPVIPHRIEAKNKHKALSCLVCHKKGGFVSEYNAYAPITPHPDLINCRQCHVSQVELKSFTASGWKSVSPPKLQQSALIGAPPVIPHPLQMRESCLACHSGPSAPREIATSHPERINCRQCHVPQKQVTIWAER